MSEMDSTEKITIIPDAPQPRRHKKKPRWGRIILLIVIVLIIILGCIGFNIYTKLQPVQSQSETVAFTIDEQSTSKTICQKLQNEGIIKDANVAYYYAKFGKLTNFKAGNFELDKNWTLEKIFTTLNDISASHANSASVTIVEGDWAKDAAKKFAKGTNVTADQLIALWSNQEWLTSQMAKYPFLTEEMFNSNIRIYLEGYLTPETYIVDQDTTAEEITTQLLDQTLAVYNKYSAAMQKSNLTVHQIYTLASIVQYEGGGDAETLKNIASVFYNRLSIDMALQSSVTVCYAIDFDKTSDSWQACEFNSDFDSPYNTYKYTGLPPGAIENAGTAALDAVLNPNDTNYLYFMADVKTGKVYYAETYEQHLQNIADHPNS